MPKMTCVAKKIRVKKLNDFLIIIALLNSVYYRKIPWQVFFFPFTPLKYFFSVFTVTTVTSFMKTCDIYIL